MAKKTMTNEFLIRYLHDFEDYNKLIESSCKKWNTVAKNQLRRKIKNTEDIWEDEKIPTRSLEIGFQNGSKAHFLFIPEDISVFDLHSEIQVEFKDGIQEYDKISFNLLGLNPKHQEILVSSLSSAVQLYQWKPPTYGKKAKKKKKEKKDFGFYCGLPGEKIENLIREGEAIAEGTNLVRTLATTPTNYMTSKDLVKITRNISKKLRGSKFDFLDERQLKSMEAGCFLSVLRGTRGSDGGIVNLSHRTRAKNAKNIAIIGKGIVFDTGGYDIKEGMEDMHKDMTGAAVALALFQALVKTKVKANLDVYLAIGENLISESAYKSNDVVIALDGTSVEITNTDAEGRMLLADTLLYAKVLEPDLIIDFATLTAEAVSSVDDRYSCVFTNSYELGLDAVKIGNESGERMWNFPMSRDYSEQIIASDVADILQCPMGENADHIYAAAFLKYFVGNDIPWIHVDLSSEKSEDGLGLVDTDTTGFGVRWGFKFIQDFILNLVGVKHG